MTAKIFIILLLVAFSSAFVIIPDNYNSEPVTQFIDAETLNSDTQEYLNRQFVDTAKEESVVELDQLPEEAEEIISKMFNPNIQAEGHRTKRKVVVCRYIAIRNNRTKKTVVVIRCRK